MHSWRWEQSGAKGPQTSQPKATPWEFGPIEHQAERARQSAPPFQGFESFLFFPGRCPGLACLRTFGARSRLAPKCMTGSGPLSRATAKRATGLSSFKLLRPAERERGCEDRAGIPAQASTRNEREYAATAMAVCLGRLLADAPELVRRADEELAVAHGDAAAGALGPAHGDGRELRAIAFVLHDHCAALAEAVDFSIGHGR